MQIKINNLKNNGENCYAIVVEPLSASTLRLTTNEFLVKARKLCDEENILLIYDEIYSVGAKLGDYLIFLDLIIFLILVYAKSFGGGKASISGYTTREHVMLKAYDNSDDFSLQSSTYNGFGEETITAIEAINVMIDNNYENKSISNGKKLKDILERIRIKFPNIIDEIRGSEVFKVYI